jgi:hypothetical protein
VENLFECVAKHISFCFGYAIFSSMKHMKRIEKNALSSPRLSAVGPIVPILPALFVPGPRILRADRKALNVSFIFFNPGFPDFLKQKSFTFYMIHMTHMTHTSSTAQGGGGSFKYRKPIGEVGCCESRMAERIH